MQRQFHQQQLHDIHRLGPKPKQQLAVGPGSTVEAGLQDSAEQEGVSALGGLAIGRLGKGTV